MSIENAIEKLADAIRYHAGTVAKQSEPAPKKKAKAKKEEPAPEPEVAEEPAREPEVADEPTEGGVPDIKIVKQKLIALSEERSRDDVKKILLNIAGTSSLNKVDPEHYAEIISKVDGLLV